jgi:two-component system phosphate regulon sensor histidine kinase PhoR
MRALALAAALAAMPVLALAVMAGAGWAAAGPAFVAIGLTLLVALAVAVLWMHDVGVLTEAVRSLASDVPLAARGRPTLALLEEPTRAVERLARHVATSGALVDRLQRADAAIVEGLPDSLIVLAADRSMLRANAAARDAFGTDIGAVLRHPGLHGAIERAFAQRAPQIAEVSLPVPVQREVHAIVVPMDPPLADGGQAVVVLSDRSRERVLERMRADFVANASHELRTPLASLIGFIDTLRGAAADDPEAQQRFLGIMAEQGARMNRLIDDLLSLSRIELMEHQAPEGSVDLATLVPRFAAEYAARWNTRGVTLDVQVPPELPRVRADADQLEQVLQNLLDNAVKYGRADGTVRVSVATPPSGTRWPARPGVVLAVADQGAGIPREHLPRLTERFYRVDTGRSRAVGGTGLGLAIVKHIVNRHRGQLVIDSEEGVGTTVSIWLPEAAG